MIYFWIGSAIILIIVGLFIITQGGAQIGGTLALLGVAIVLILAICPAHAEGLGRADNCQANCRSDRNHDANHLKHGPIWASMLS